MWRTAHRVRAPRSGRGRLEGDPRLRRQPRARPTGATRSPPSSTGGPPVVDGGAADATTDATATGARRGRARRRRSVSDERAARLSRRRRGAGRGGRRAAVAAPAGAPRPTSRRVGRPRFRRLAPDETSAEAAVANAVVPGVPAPRWCRGGWTGWQVWLYRCPSCQGWLCPRGTLEHAGARRSADAARDRVRELLAGGAGGDGARDRGRDRGVRARSGAAAWCTRCSRCCGLPVVMRIRARAPAARHLGRSRWLLIAVFVAELRGDGLEARSRASATVRRTAACGRPLQGDLRARRRGCTCSATSTSCSRSATASSNARRAGCSRRVRRSRRRRRSSLDAALHPASRAHRRQRRRRRRDRRLRRVAAPRPGRDRALAARVPPVDARLLLRGARVPGADRRAARPRHRLDRPPRSASPSAPPARRCSRARASARRAEGPR